MLLAAIWWGIKSWVQKNLHTHNDINKKKNIYVHCSEWERERKNIFTLASGGGDNDLKTQSIYFIL